MLRRLLCISILGLAVLGACVSEPDPETATLSAAVNVPVVLDGDIHTTARSGKLGAAFTVGDAASDDFALWGMYGKERSDDPCWVQVNTEALNTTIAKGAAAKELCGSSGPNNSSLLSADFADGDFTGPRAFISGVKVCMNNDQSKVKGWILYGREITEDGDLVDLTLHATAGPRPNCTTWMSQVNCPAGELATAAVFHFDTTTEPRSWIGVALKCRAVTVL